MGRKRSKILAIVCAKKESKRFKEKNKILINDVFEEISNSKLVDDILFLSDETNMLDAKYISVLRIYRPGNACEPEDSVFNIAKWGYYCLEEDYDIVVIIFANVVNLKSEYIDKGIKLIEDSNLNDVRSYNKKGVENGLIFMKKDYFLNGPISTYCGGIFTDAVEIHTKGELLDDINR